MPTPVSRTVSAKLRIVFYTLALLGLCVYSAVVGPLQVTTVRDVQKNSAGFHGQEFRLSSQIKVSQLMDDGFLIDQRGAKMHVRIPAKDANLWKKEKRTLKVGDVVTLRGQWHSEGYLLLEELHIQKLQLVRILVSALAILALLVLFLYKGNTRLFQNA